MMYPKSFQYFISQIKNHKAHMGLGGVLSHYNIGKYVYIFVILDLTHFNVIDVYVKMLLQHIGICATLYIKHTSYNFIINTLIIVANIYKKNFIFELCCSSILSLPSKCWKRKDISVIIYVKRVYGINICFCHTKWMLLSVLIFLFLCVWISKQGHISN